MTRHLQGSCPVADRLTAERAASYVPDYPEIDEAAVLDALPEGTIVMMDPADPEPVLWVRTVRPNGWVKRHPLSAGWERLSSMALIQRRVSPDGTRRLVLVWTKPAGSGAPGV